MKIKLDPETIMQAAKAMILNTLINNYAVERVAFGYEKPGDVAPIDLYIEHLFFGFDYEPQMRKDVPGIYIDEQERISAEYDYPEYVRDLFVDQMERIFFDAPKDARLERNGEELPLSPRFRDCLFGFLPLFEEVLSAKVKYDVFDVIPADKTKNATEYDKWARFVASILLKPLRPNSRIDRYVSGFTNPPYYVARLIEKRGKDHYLKPIDVNGYEYAFALFSLMSFKNGENDRLLELKMREWESRRI